MGQGVVVLEDHPDPQLDLARELRVEHLAERCAGQVAVGRLEYRCVQEVESVGLQLERDPASQRDSLAGGQIHNVQTGAANDADAAVAEGAGPRQHEGGGIEPAPDTDLARALDAADAIGPTASRPGLRLIGREDRDREAGVRLPDARERPAADDGVEPARLVRQEAAAASPRQIPDRGHRQIVPHVGCGWAPVGVTVPWVRPERRCLGGLSDLAEEAPPVGQRSAQGIGRRERESTREAFAGVEL